MPEPEQLPQSQVVRIIAERDRLAFALFLGAGASKSAGVDLASEMIEEWRRLAHCDHGGGIDFETWCQKQKWYKKPDEYSRLFELVYLDPPSRQKYIESKIKDAFPSWGYLYLANIVQHGRFNVIFTTNFDDLINEALTIFLGYNPIVCAADSDVATINITSERAKIIKLHGDYLFESIKNTEEELRRLTENMERKFKEFATLCGFVVIGYAGCDESIMRVFEEMLKEPRTFPHGIYWGVRPGSEVGPRVEQLSIAHSRRFHLFTCPGFDDFMARLHDVSGAKKNNRAQPLDLPGTIVDPFKTLKARYERLLNSAGPKALDDPTIRLHMKDLEEELNLPWAQATPDEFDLLQAQMALGRRDYKKALEGIARFIAKHPTNAEGLTTWGNALAVQSEEEGAEAASEQAVEKWKEALKNDPATLAPRYSLARYYALKHRSAEGIEICEQLIKLAPNDIGLRRNLVQFYGDAGRYDDAERELQWLLQREPKNADLHGMRASLFEQRGLIPEAIGEVRLAVSLAPQNPWLRMGLANSLVKINRAEEAAAAFEEAIRLEPRNLAFRIQVATFYSMRQQPQRALPHLQTAVAIGPLSAEARGWLCQVLLALGDFAAAQTEGEEAVRLSPSDSRLRMTVGMAYQQTGCLQEAEHHYSTAVQLNPHAPEGYAALCWLYSMQDRTAELRSTMQRLGQVNPQAAQMMQTQIQMQQAQRMQQRGPAQNWIGALQDQLRSFVQGHTPVGPPPVPGAQGQQPPPIPNIWYRPR